jgi:hypothetical protein
MNRSPIASPGCHQVSDEVLEDWARTLCEALTLPPILNGRAGAAESRNSGQNKICDQLRGLRVRSD